MRYKIPENAEIKKIVEEMSVEELLLSVVCPEVGGNRKKLYNNTVAVFHHCNTSDVLKERIGEINKGRKLQAVMVTDIEAGAGNLIKDATVFPSMMACSVANSEELAYEMGKISAIESRKVGFEWAFGPCVDISGNHDNPITSTRCCGDDYKQVIKIAGAVMKGMQDYGLAAAVKHFPGDGYCMFDQHLTVAENPMSYEEWKNTYGKVYQYMIDEGVKSIMPGHISLPSYDDIDEETGLYPPGSMSKKLLTDLLKNELGFEGIIVSDGANMSGFSGYINFYKACARFLEAGGDCLIFVQPDEMFMDEMKKLIEIGYLSIETLKNRAYRMLCFCQDLKSFEPIETISDHEALKVVKEILDRSIHVVRDRKGIIPFNINRDTRILHMTVDTDLELHKDFNDDITHELKKYTEFVDVINDPGPDAMINAVKLKKYDLIICTVGSAPSYGTNVVRLSGPIARNMMGGWMRYDTPVIFVAKQHGYFHEEYEATADTVINTYGYACGSAEKLVSLITGKENK